jgi:L-iditol 2-dehydrogenase
MEMDEPVIGPGEVLLRPLAWPVGCCVQGVEDCSVTAGDAVLVVGDGPMGLLCAAVARAYGAGLVIVAGLTPHRLAVAEEHYADAVIHVGEEDLLERVAFLTEDRGADVVLVAVSSAEAVEAGLGALRRGGVLNAFAGVPEGTTIPLDLRQVHYGQIRITGSFGVGPYHVGQAMRAKRAQAEAGRRLAGHEISPLTEDQE